MLTLNSILTNAEVEAVLPALLQVEERLAATAMGAASDDSRDPTALALATFRKLTAPLSAHLVRLRESTTKDRDRTRRYKGNGK